MSFAAPSGVKLHVDVYKNCLPRDVIFVHGNLASNVWWEPSLEHLKDLSASSETPGSAICVEWRGTARTRQLDREEQFSLDEIASDICALASHYNKPCLVGHSLGGLLAGLALAKGKGSFSRSVLLNPVGPLGAKLTPEILAGFESMRTNRELCTAIMASTIRGCDQTSERFARIVDDAQNVSPALYTAVPKLLDGIDYRDALKQITEPVLVLHGDEDRVLPWQAAESFAQLIPNGKFVLLEQAGHSFNMEQPRRFAEILNESLFG